MTRARRTRPRPAMRGALGRRRAALRWPGCPPLACACSSGLLHEWPCWRHPQGQLAPLLRNSLCLARRCLTAPSPVPPPNPAAPAASRVCDLTGARANNGYTVTFSHKRNKKLQQVNLQYKKVYWPEGQRWVKLRISTRAMKSVEKKGLQVRLRAGRPVARRWALHAGRGCSGPNVLA